MKKLTIKGIDPTLLTTYVKKSALLAIKKDNIVSDVLPLYIYKDSVVSIKEDGSATTHKLWEIPLEKFCTNHKEIAEKLGDNFCRLAIFSCKQFVLKGLKYFSDAIDMEILLSDESSDSFDAVGVVTIKNNKSKFRFSVTDATHAFKNISGGWEFVDEFFNTDDGSGTIASFTLSKDELKRIKELTKINNVVDKKHEFVCITTDKGYLKAYSHSVDINLHESQIELSDINIKNSTLMTLCDESYNVFIKNFRNIPFIIFKSVDTNTQQIISVLTEFNTNVDLESVEDEIAQVDFSEWDSQDDDPLF